jgi:hypothetical protein
MADMVTRSQYLSVPSKEESALLNGNSRFSKSARITTAIDHYSLPNFDYNSGWGATILQSHHTTDR